VCCFNILLYSTNFFLCEESKSQMCAHCKLKLVRLTVKYSEILSCLKEDIVPWSNFPSERELDNARTKFQFKNQVE
jgi:hypothetical protein